MRLVGHEARPLLQGLVTCDLRLLSAERSLYGALLTPQGKYGFAFHIILEQSGEDGEETLWLETSGNRLAELERRLMLYRLRAPVAIERVSPEPNVAVVFGEDTATLAGLDAIPGAMARESGLVLQVDPRLAELGIRLYGAPGDIEAWLTKHEVRRVDALHAAQHRIALAIPEPDTDLVVDKTIMLEAGLDQLGAVAFDKGCFVGQELTARTHYRGLIKRRLVPIELEAAGIEPGTPVMAGERDVGDIRSVAGRMALAMLRLDRLGEPLRAGGGSVLPRPAPWQSDLADQLRNAAAGQ